MIVHRPASDGHVRDGHFHSPPNRFPLLLLVSVSIAEHARESILLFLPCHCWVLYASNRRCLPFSLDDGLLGHTFALKDIHQPTQGVQGVLYFALAQGAHSPK